MVEDVPALVFKYEKGFVSKQHEEILRAMMIDTVPDAATASTTRLKQMLQAWLHEGGAKSNYKDMIGGARDPEEENKMIKILSMIMDYEYSMEIKHRIDYFKGETGSGSQRFVEGLKVYFDSYYKKAFPQDTNTGDNIINLQRELDLAFSQSVFDAIAHFSIPDFPIHPDDLSKLKSSNIWPALVMIRDCFTPYLDRAERQRGIEADRQAMVVPTRIRLGQESSAAEDVAASMGQGRIAVKTVAPRGKGRAGTAADTAASRGRGQGRRASTATGHSAIYQPPDKVVGDRVAGQGENILKSLWDRTKVFKPVSPASPVTPASLPKQSVLLTPPQKKQKRKPARRALGDYSNKRTKFSSDLAGGKKNKKSLRKKSTRKSLRKKSTRKPLRKKSTRKSTRKSLRKKSIRKKSIRKSLRKKSIKKKIKKTPKYSKKKSIRKLSKRKSIRKLSKK